MARVVLAAALALLSASLAAPARPEPREGGAQDSPLWALADRAIPRTQVLEQVRALPAGPDRDAMLAILERMVKEDAAHRVPERDVETLPLAERIAELVWRLRDETGSGPMANGGPPMLFPPPGFAPGPATTASRLASFRHAALPALVAVLDDDGYTRAVYDSRAGTEVRVLRIGEVARLIAERIAGRPLDTNDAVRAWWSAVREKGEFLADADEVEATSGYSALYICRRLLELDPVAATPLIVRAARRERDPLVRKLFLDLVSGLVGDSVERFLMSETASGPHLLHRAAAALARRDRGHIVDPAPMFEAWRDLREFGSGDCLAGTDHYLTDTGLYLLVLFCASSGSAGLSTLATDLDARPPWVRGLVAQVLGGGDVAYCIYGYVGRVPRAAPSPPDPAMAVRVLRSLLEDRAAVHSSYAPDHRPARVNDLAARSIARLLPGAHEFDPNAPLAERDAAIERMRTSR